ncbi:Oxidoreductase [Fulvivirga imtechensis AK7]|uniref:Oxidoreductase n=1 Tax=Fulvivirga imtechensis AK7 TaxID=1237149 RepID=L8JS47_9BACT|nr:2OG-Fe(II) oxygenase [Fulvivirga imtechensis]ELR71043.1 Oxidoreductase [Fulvivirga imtechensis AK7]
MNITTDSLEFIADNLANQDYAIVDHFLSLEEVNAILEVFALHQDNDKFKRAGIGKDENLQYDRSIRGDYIKWIDPQNAMPPVKLFLSKIDELKDYLNRTCFLGIKDYETHFTIYPPGSFYKRHLDQFQNDGARKISFICYLNKNWQSGDGGELRLYLGDEVKDVAPTAGKLACFRSEIIEHEVLLSKKDRFSLTGWMLNHPVGLGFVV